MRWQIDSSSMSRTWRIDCSLRKIRVVSHVVADIDACNCSP